MNPRRAVGRIERHENPKKIPLARLDSLLAFWFAFLCCFQVSALRAQDLPDRAAAYVAQYLEATGMPGVSAAISVGGEIVWSGGAGYADLENEVPASGRTVHRIASISKPITAVALMQLVEDGKVDLDAEIQEYVPYFPRKEWPVTVRHLLTHTSGVRHYQGLEFGTKVYYRTVEDALGVFMNDPLKFEPGTQYSYSTYGYNVLAGVIESVSGQGFGDYLKMNVWARAGMDSTDLELRGVLVHGRARGYTRRRDGEFRNVPYTDLSVKWAGGGIISTVEDLLRFADALLKEKLVTGATLKKMLTPYELKNGDVTTYGLGFQVGVDAKGRRVFGHSGGSTGFSSRLFIYPDDGIAAATISNMQNAGGMVTPLARSLASMALGDEVETP